MRFHDLLTLPLARLRKGLLGLVGAATPGSEESGDDERHEGEQESGNAHVARPFGTGGSAREDARDPASIPTTVSDVDAPADLAHQRVEYGSQALTKQVAGADPMQLFAAWFADARTRPNVAEANAMTLATATADGVPSARMVLLKDVDEARAAFTWYTNLESRKAVEIGSRAEPRAALLWWWPGDSQDVPGRQVRVVGRVELVERDRAADYFASRPRAARASALASAQSRPIASRAELEARCADHSGDAATLPDHWGGMRLVADEIEFWQGRSGRLHDRIAFHREQPDRATPPEEADEVVDASGTTWWRVRLQP